jgi:DNA-binding NarL/FixJ family response regulator
VPEGWARRECRAGSPGRRPHPVQGGPGVIARRKRRGRGGGHEPTGEEAAERVARTKPDLILTQLDMDLKTAEEILSAIREASPHSRIVVLTVFDNLHFLKALSKMGIDAYVHKSSSPEELTATIDALSRQAERQNAVISMPRGMLERLGEEPVGGLSERETEVLVLVARGFSNAQIASSMHLSEATVKRHLANAYPKIGVNSMSEAVRKALMEQWIGLTEITREAPSADGFERDGTPSG